MLASLVRQFGFGRVNGVLVVRRMIDSIRDQVAKLDAAVAEINAHVDRNAAAIDADFERHQKFRFATEDENRTLQEHARKGVALAANLGDLLGV